MQSIVSVSPLVLVGSRPRARRPDLIDGLTDAIVSAPDQLARSQVITELLGEIYESVARLYTDPDSSELVSLRHMKTEVAADLHRLGLSAEVRALADPEAERAAGPTVAAQGAEEKPTPTSATARPVMADV